MWDCSAYSNKVNPKQCFLRDGKQNNQISKQAIYCSIKQTVVRVCASVAQRPLNVAQVQLVHSAEVWDGYRDAAVRNSCRRWPDSVGSETTTQTESSTSSCLLAGMQRSGLVGGGGGVGVLREGERKSERVLYSSLRHSEHTGIHPFSPGRAPGYTVLLWFPRIQSLLRATPLHITPTLNQPPPLSWSNAYDQT